MRARRCAVGSDRANDSPPPLEDQEWEQNQIEQIARRFPKRFADELRAELALSLFQIKQRRTADIRNWKGYVATALKHRALSLARKWRGQERREISIPIAPEPEPANSAEAPSDRQEAQWRISEIRRALDTESYRFLELLTEVRGNKARLARRLGVHRNTILRRLQRIRRTLIRCPIENVTALERQELEQIAHYTSGRPRDRFKARLLLALIAGASYT